MTPSRALFWHWPGRHLLGSYLLLVLAVGLWFEVVYAGADWITAQHDYRVRVHLEAELQTPFVPATVLGYLSIYLLMMAPPFILGTRRELRALAQTLIVVITCAGLGFLLLPVATAFPAPKPMGYWQGPVQFAKAVALEHNLLPSLHVAMSVVCVAIYTRKTRWLGKFVLWSWALGIGLSTLLLHQHYLLDVVTGWLLGLAGVRWGYERWLRDAAHLPEA
jgi:membrane-associated phospholipid phosphatase